MSMHACIAKVEQGPRGYALKPCATRQTLGMGITCHTGRQRPGRALVRPAYMPYRQARSTRYQMA